MYKNAPKFHRSARDDPDPSEVRDAAGIEPKGTPEFVRQVKFAILKGGKASSNISQLVGYLNRQDIPNARGYPWTHAALEAFIKHYLRSGRRNSN